jgi:hypothetical protein
MKLVLLGVAIGAMAFAACQRAKAPAATVSKSKRVETDGNNDGIPCEPLWCRH